MSAKSIKILGVFSLIWCIVFSFNQHFFQTRCISRREDDLKAFALKDMSDSLGIVYDFT